MVMGGVIPQVVWSPDSPRRGPGSSSGVGLGDGCLAAGRLTS